MLQKHVVEMDLRTWCKGSCRATTRDDYRELAVASSETRWQPSRQRENRLAGLQARRRPSGVVALDLPHGAFCLKPWCPLSYFWQSSGYSAQRRREKDEDGERKRLQHPSCFHSCVPSIWSLLKDPRAPMHEL